jgi:hypothetical protein
MKGIVPAGGKKCDISGKYDDGRKHEMTNTKDIEK